MGYQVGGHVRGRPDNQRGPGGRRHGAQRRADGDVTVYRHSLFHPPYDFGQRPPARAAFLRRYAHRHEGYGSLALPQIKRPAGGLLVGCRDAARQHPKEFEVFADRMVLHLFSNRAGEELDYRTKTLMKRWNLPEWIRLHNRKGRANGTRNEKEMIV